MCDKASHHAHNPITVMSCYTSHVICDKLPNKFVRPTHWHPPLGAATSKYVPITRDFPNRHLPVPSPLPPFRLPTPSVRPRPPLRIGRCFPRLPGRRAPALARR